MNGKVYLVGAGCGDPELITWKGLNLLRKCDVVLYDDLAAPKLLEEVKADCELIFAGKRYGKHSLPQNETNALLVQKAKEGKMVVRLKGGDPFVFGRGGEEVLALQAENIPYEVVSGVTSSIAVPAAAGIPVTHRRTARSFHVITGHTAENGKGAVTENLDVLAKLEGTLVFLMGLHHLEEITRGLLAGGKDFETPAAVISRGTTPYQRTVRANLGELTAKVRGAELEAPAIIVVGETAELDFSRTIPRPLYGRKIGVTGTKSVTGKLRDRLEELGAAVTEMDYSVLVPYRENLMLEKQLHCISDYTWAIFTSPNGVEIFFDYLKKRKLDVRKLVGLQFAVIGTGTAAALEKRGVYASYLPEKYNVESFADGLCEKVAENEKILILRAEQGNDILLEKLDAAGLHYTDVKIYDIRVDEEKRKEALSRVQEMDFITFASGSGVRGFLEDGGEIPAGTKVVCIGDSTQKMLQKYGYDEMLVAEKFNVDGVVDMIVKAVEK